MTSPGRRQVAKPTLPTGHRDRKAVTTPVQLNPTLSDPSGATCAGCSSWQVGTPSHRRWPVGSASLACVAWGTAQEPEPTRTGDFRPSSDPRHTCSNECLQETLRRTAMTTLLVLL